MIPWHYSKAQREVRARALPLLRRPRAGSLPAAAAESSPGSLAAGPALEPPSTTVFAGGRTRGKPRAPWGLPSSGDDSPRQSGDGLTVVFHRELSSGKGEG